MAWRDPRNELVHQSISLRLLTNSIIFTALKNPASSLLFAMNRNRSSRISSRYSTAGVPSATVG